MLYVFFHLFEHVVILMFSDHTFSAQNQQTKSCLHEENCLLNLGGCHGDVRTGKKLTRFVARDCADDLRATNDQDAELCIGRRAARMTTVETSLSAHAAAAAAAVVLSLLADADTSASSIVRQPRLAAYLKSRFNSDDDSA